MSADNPLDPHVVETQFLKNLDDKAAKIRRKLLCPSSNQLTPQESHDWIVFLMSLHARRPGAVRNLRSTGVQQLLVGLDKEPDDYRAIAKESDPISLSQWVQENEPHLLENITMLQFPAIATHPETRKKITRFAHHSVVDLSSCTDHLLLSDTPCIWPYGIDDPKAILALPISPHALFVTTRSDAVFNNLQRLSPDGVLALFNSFAVGQAREQVYALNCSLRHFILDQLSPSN